MDISAIIGKHITALMESTPDLDTCKKLAQRAGVGFGTVQRAKNGEGNITVQNLAAIANAFKKSPEDLMQPAFEKKPHLPTGECVSEPTAEYRLTSAHVKTIAEICQTLPPEWQTQALGAVRMIAAQYAEEQNSKNKRA